MTSALLERARRSEPVVGALEAAVDVGTRESTVGADAAEHVVGAVAHGGERTSAGGSRLGRQTLSLFEDLGGGPTLDTVLAGVWEGLAARHVVACPVCGGRMAAVGEPSGSGPVGGWTGPAGGECRSCGTTLS